MVRSRSVQVKASAGTEGGRRATECPPTARQVRRAVAGLERGLQARQGDLVAEALDAAKRHIGELSMENELLRERARAAEQRRPLAMRRSRR